MKELRTEFEGKGEVRGYHFRQVVKDDNYYIYEVTDNDAPDRKHYELFQRKVNKQYNVESYPGSPSFGLWAWTYPDLASAIDGVKHHGL